MGSSPERHYVYVKPDRVSPGGSVEVYVVDPNTYTDSVTLESGTVQASMVNSPNIWSFLLEIPSDTELGHMSVRVEDSCGRFKNYAEFDVVEEGASQSFHISGEVTLV